MSDDNPLLDAQWVRTLGDEIYNQLCGREATERDRIADKRHRELVDTHREGWKNVATAITGGLGAIAAAIRDTHR